MNANTLEIGVKELRKIIPALITDNLSDDFFIAEVKDVEELDKLREPYRFGGYLIFHCLEGELSIEINLKRYLIPEGALLFSIPGNIIRNNPGESPKKCKFVVLAASKELLTQGRVDFSHLFNESLKIINEPCIHPDHDDVALLDRYLRLIYRLSRRGGGVAIREAVSSILVSAFYFLSELWQKNIQNAEADAKESSQTPRARRVFEDFIKLVGEYHTVERGMAFYAGKLGLTPKYLSKQIKQVTGRSGPDWIDSFVIVEAKNFLKYSDLPVKEIVKKLNFTNSSVFHKFFKAHTGMTPSEYRR